jgi:hypothetical protein
MNPTTNTEAGAVADMAGKLTEAQRKAILAARQGAREKQPWINIGMARVTTVSALREAGIVDYHEPPARLTPLGLAVRAHLSEQGATAGVKGDTI